MDRKIKVIKCGELFNCESGDRISIEFSASEVSILKEVFEERAMNATDYLKQGDEREMRELFITALLIWEKERREKDK